MVLIAFYALDPLLFEVSDTPLQLLLVIGLDRKVDGYGQRPRSCPLRSPKKSGIARS